MRSNRFSATRKAFCLGIGFVSFALWGQQNAVSVEPPAPLTVHSGTTVTQNLKISVQPGFHVNSDKPKDDFVIPLKLTWLSGPLTVQSITYPKPEEVKVGNDTLTVFTGDFTIRSQFLVPQQATPGSSVMLGRLRYQACNNQMCLRPKTVDVRLPVTIQ